MFMHASLIHPANARITETPNATMTTLASPSLNGTQDLSLWRVAITAGKEGPVHVFDSEQIWTLLSGAVTFEVEGDRFQLGPGDTIRIAGMATRQLRAQTDAIFLVCGYGGAMVVSGAPGGQSMTPVWIS
jgi:quercetin dioxygenase-like cupin family protein